MPAKPNAYSLFVSENCNRLRREGQNPKYHSLFEALAPKWQSMSAAEKQRYKDRAKQPRDGPASGSYSNPARHVLSDSAPTSQPGTNQGSKIDAKAHIDLKPSDFVERKVSTKRSHDEIDWDDNELSSAHKEKKPKPGIPNHWRARQVDPERYPDIHLVKIRESCKAIIASRANNLISMPIYSFSVNVLCYKRSDDGEKFVPIEIGICAYSLKAGRLGQPYHALIDAGPPLEGCVNSASDHAETHKITIPTKDSYPAGARKDYRKIYKEIVDYTKAGERTILVWDAREMKQVTGSLEWLHERASQQSGPGKLPKVSTWTVLPVMEFTANMGNFVHQNMLGNKDSVFILHYYINMLLESSVYDYEKDLMCQYHKGVESKWCARSCALRMFLCIEKCFEEIYKGFMYATNPAFLKAKMNPPPLLYHQHRPSQQFLAEQANAASSINSEQAQPIVDDQQSTEDQPVLALPEPERAPSPETVDNPVGMTIEDEAPSPDSAPETDNLTQTPRDPKISA